MNKIDSMIRDCMRFGDKKVLGILRLVKCKMEADLKSKLKVVISDDDLFIKCVVREKKERIDSKDDFAVAFLSTFLPLEKSPEECEEVVVLVMSRVEGMGKIMGELKKIEGLNMKYCSQLVKERLK